MSAPAYFAPSSSKYIFHSSKVLIRTPFFFFSGETVSFLVGLDLSFLSGDSLLFFSGFLGGGGVTYTSFLS